MGDEPDTLAPEERSPLGEPPRGASDPGRPAADPLPAEGAEPSAGGSASDVGWISAPWAPGKLVAVLVVLSLVSGVAVETMPADGLLRGGLRGCVGVGLASAWLYVLTWRVWQQRLETRWSWTLPLGLGLLLALGQVALQPGRPYLPPLGEGMAEPQAGDWTVWALLCAGALGGLRVGYRPDAAAWRRLGPVGVCLIGGGLAWLILRTSLHPYSFDPPNPHFGAWLPQTDAALYAVLGAGGLIALLTLAIRGLIGHSRLPEAPLPERRAAAFLGASSLALLGACSAGAIGISGSETLAFQAALVTAALTPWLLLALWRGAVLPRAVAFPLAVAFAGAWLTSRTHSGLPAKSMVLLYLGAWAPRLGASRVLRQRQRWLATAFGLGLGLLAGGGAVHFAYQASPYARPAVEPSAEGTGEAADPYADYGGY